MALTLTLTLARFPRAVIRLARTAANAPITRSDAPATTVTVAWSVANCSIMMGPPIACSLILEGDGARRTWLDIPFCPAPVGHDGPMASTTPSGPPEVPQPPQAPQAPQGGVGRTRLQALRDIALGPDSYGIVFLFLIGDYVFLTVGWHGSVALIVSSIWLGLTLLLAFRTSQVPQRMLLAVRIAVGVLVVSAVGAAVGGGDRANGTIVILGSILVLASPIAIGWRLLHHTRVTTQTVLGALCIYVLIGLVFANADYGVQLVSGASFFAQSGSHGPADFAYFSYITMATVGYGDLTPATGLPRTLAVLEALMGQIFLVVLVARLVGMYTPTFRWGHEVHGGALRSEAGEVGAVPPGVEGGRG